MPRATPASANKTGSRSEAHQGLKLKGGPTQRGRRRTLAARRRGARGGPAAGRLPASGLLGSAPGVPVRETRRSGRSGALRRCGNRHGGATHRRRSRVEFRRGRGSNRGKRARRGAWERGETTTRLWEAWGVAEPRGYGGAGEVCASELRECDGLRVWGLWWRRWRGGVQGGRAGYL